LDSLGFLSRNQDDEYGKIRVYDLGSVFKELQKTH